MASHLFCSTSPDFVTVQLQDIEKEEVLTKGNQDNFLPKDGYFGRIYPFSPEFGSPAFFSTQVLQDFPEDQQPPQLPLQSNHLALDEYLNYCFQAPAEPQQNVSKLSQELQHPYASSSSLELLRNHGSRFKKLKLNQLDPSNSSNETRLPDNRKRLSTQDIMMVAGARYIRLSDQKCDELEMIMNPFGQELQGLSEEELREVQLAHLLLAAAEKVGRLQFDNACRLLSHCGRIASERINPVQRYIICFVEALRERINKGTGNLTVPNESVMPRYEYSQGSSTDLASLTFLQNVPFSQAIQLTAIQCIVENIGSTRKLHFIDLHIKSGVQWAALMQALAERKQPQLKQLKLTAVILKEKEKTDKIGKNLERLAKSLNLPFRFKALYVSSLSDIRDDHFHIAGDESVVVFSEFILRTMISTPSCLENLMRVIRNLNPSLMVVVEIEANHNSPTFVNRFIEALFYYSALFDCVETCMGQYEECVNDMDEKFCRGIKDIVAMEGSERICRSVTIAIWRAFFLRSKMVEIGFSSTSLYQAGLILERFPCGRLCSVCKNGKSVLFLWKGMPLFSLSAWKFSREILGRLIVT